MATKECVHCECTGHHHSNDSCCACTDNHSSIKTLAIRLVAGFTAGLAGVFLSGLAGTVLFAVSYIILGYDVLFNAVKNLIKGKPLDEHFLMTIAALGAFALGEYLEAAAVMMFYQIGELLTHNAVEKTKSSIAALTDVRPDMARIITAEGEALVHCKDIAIGTTVIVGAGERIPVDGKIKRGSAMIDTSSLTGEHLPRYLEVGDSVLSGMISTDGSLEIVAEKEFSDSTLSRILTLAKEAYEKKSGAERFITSFAKIYTPIVVALAAMVAILPPVLGLGAFSVWVYRALSFLVISCPCALVVSVPLTFFAGMGCSSKNGVLIKNGLAIENLSKVKTVALDKTGTVTVGIPTLTEICVNGREEELLELAAYAETDSAHPISAAVKAAYAKPIDRSRISNITEIPARGVEAEIDRKIVTVGSAKLFNERGIEIPDHSADSCIYVARDGQYMGHIGFGDKVKATSAAAIGELKKCGIATVMLSGDSKKSVDAVAKEVGITEAFAELLPHEKAEHISRISKDGTVMFVGDGINDSPALASAAVGAAMGAIGSDAAVEAADVVVMGDDLLKIPAAIKLSKKVMAIARENIILSVGIKFLVMIICAFGVGGMWPAIFADVGVCVLTVLNALRAYYIKAFRNFGR